MKKVQLMTLEQRRGPKKIPNGFESIFKMKFEFSVLKTAACSCMCITPGKGARPIQSIMQLSSVLTYCCKNVPLAE